jgi:predicted phosphoribosyltransferase
VDELICVERPIDLWAISLWYDDFTQVADAEVAAMLSARTEATAGRGPAANPPA